MRLCDDRTNFREINFKHLFVVRILVRVQNGDRLSAVRFQVVDCLRIHLAETGLCPRLNAEIAERNAVSNAERSESLAAELHGLIIRAVCADLADDGENQIPRVNTRAQLAAKLKAQGLRHQNPALPRDHRIEIVGAADTGSERAERAVGTGVGVRAEDKLSRGHIFFQHNLMTDALALIEGNAVCARKIAHLLMRGRCLHRVRRDIVIDNPDQFILVSNARVL